MISSFYEEGEWESGGRDGDRGEREGETQGEILFFFVK
jgi:hypothetical protein